MLTLINDHTRAATLHMTNMTLQSKIDRYSSTTTALTIVRGNLRHQFYRMARHFTPCRFDDDVCPWNTTSMQPDIIARSLTECYFFVLPAILTNQYCEAIRRLHM